LSVAKLLFFAAVAIHAHYFDLDNKHPIGVEEDYNELEDERQLEGHAELEPLHR